MGISVAEYRKQIKSPGKTPKYRNVKTVGADGIKYDSKKEANRAAELELMVKTGHIRNLRRQVVYPLIVNGVKICKYIADFVYEDGFQDWKTVIEDVKSDITRKNRAYRIKVKLMCALYQIEIREV